MVVIVGRAISLSDAKLRLVMTTSLLNVVYHAPVLLLWSAVGKVWEGLSGPSCRRCGVGGRQLVVPTPTVTRRLPPSSGLIRS